MTAMANAATAMMSTIMSLRNLRCEREASSISFFMAATAPAASGVVEVRL